MSPTVEIAIFIDDQRQRLAGFLERLQQLQRRHGVRHEERRPRRLADVEALAGQRLGQQVFHLQDAEHRLGPALDHREA
jgi:hypothetical protein